MDGILNILRVEKQNKTKNLPQQNVPWNVSCLAILHTTSHFQITSGEVKIKRRFLQHTQVIKNAVESSSQRQLVTPDGI